MPLASEEQVPKALTYTLMYHALWLIMFLFSGFILMAIFFLSGQPASRALLPPLGLIFFGIVAGVGAMATYGVRIQVLLGEFSKEDAFRWSAASSWGVLIFAPVSLAIWRFVAEPLARSWWHGGQPWPVPAQIAGAMTQVEVIVWWLSHLMSIRGLSRGRRRYFGPAVLAEQAAPGAAATPAVSTEGRARAALAAEGGR